MSNPSATGGGCLITYFISFSIPAISQAAGPVDAKFAGGGLCEGADSTAIPVSLGQWSGQKAASRARTAKGGGK